MAIAASAVLVGAMAWAALAVGTEPADTYWSTVEADAPTAQYRLSDAAEASTLADSAGSDAASNSGIVLGGSGPFPGGKSGALGGEAFATLASDPLEGASEFTAEAWMNRSGGSSYGEPIFDFGSSSTDHMYLTPASTLAEHEAAFVIQTSAESSATVTAPGLAPGGWHFLAVTETSAGTLTLYIDGKQAGQVEGQTLNPSSLATATDAYLGKSLAAAPDLHGSLSNLAFYTKALSAARIEAHFNAGEFPVDATVPAISGSAEDEQELTAHPETWTGLAPIEFSYQWQRCNTSGEGCSDLSGAGEPTYLVGHEDVGHTLRVEVTATNAAGHSTARSAQTATIAAHEPSSTVAPAITGTPEDGQALSGSAGTWNGTPSISYTYQWRRCDGSGESCTNISGATSSTYEASFADVGHRLRVLVTATNAAGSVGVPSAPSAFIAPTPLTELGYASEFGEEGSGDGQFKEAFGVAVGPSGYIFVLDVGNDRIEKFDEAGEYLGQFGSEGSADGQLARPAALTVDSKGDVWVADTGNQRIEEFDEHGEFVRVAGEGLLDDPEGIAVDRAGHIWVSDYSEGRLVVFGEDGEHLKDVGSQGSEPGQLGGPEGLTVDASGHVWVADYGNSRVEQFDEVGEYLGQFGSEGAASGRLSGPWGIAVDEGHIFLGEFGFARVQEFDEEGHFIAQLGAPGSEAGQLGFPGGLAIDAAHGLLIADPSNNRVQRLSPEAPAAPADLAAPSLSGSPGVGNTYEASTGVWSGSPRRSYAFQWQRCDEAGEECTDITGATSPSYTVAEGDLGSTVRMVITASNTLGSASSASAPSEVIIEAPVNILLPTISGTLQEGVELTADPGEWERASGYGYEWQRCNALGEECADVERYWEASYTPTEEDAEHTLRVIVTAWNGAGEASATSLASAVVMSSGLPRNTELPTISSEAETLSATPGSWHSSGSLSYTYQWERCDEHGEACVGIEGATSLTYPLVEADVEHTLRVAVTATNPFGSATATSEATAVMHATPPPTNAEAPTISGVAQVSQDLTAYPGSWEHASHYAYQWQRCNGHGGGCASIEGATSSTYTLTEAEVEHTIRAAVTATGLGGNETVRTAATAVVTPITPPTNAEAPTIIGAPTAGHTLSAVHGNWSTPHEPLSYVYQWRRCDAAGESCSDIAGATAATYTAGSEDTGGHTLRVVVTATDALGVPGSASSDPRYIAAAVRTTEYSYDANGNLETRTDGNGHSTSYEYGPANEQTKVTQADGSTTETGYDGDGLVTSQTDGNGHMTKYRRNVLGQVSEVTDPLGRKTSKEYDLAGNLTRVTDPAERTTTYRYDPANRLIEKTYSDGTTPNVEYEYDADGNKLKVIDGTGTSTYHYDELDRLSEATDGHGDSTGYEYDLAGDQTKLTYQSGESVERKFDEDGRLAGIKDWLGNETSFVYDPDSNLTSTTFPEATSETDRYAYNLADQITETSFGKSSETLASVTYGRDGEGQVASTSSTELPGEASSSYTYNQANRLTKDGATAYEYDPAGNPTKLGSSAAAYDEASQPEHAGGTDFSYDAVGERTKATPSAGPSTSYGYDQAGELASVSRLSEGEAPAIEDSYAYSGDGLRTSQTSGGTTKYLSWDQSAGLPLILGDGNDSFIYGPADTPIEQIDNTTGTVTYLHHDQAGSTRLLTGSTGTVSGKCAYSAYGTPTCEGSSTPLGFDGEYTSADTGLIYMRARTYDPSTAQFLSLDPLEKLTRAPYDFAEDNPLNESDPTGLGDWLGLGIPSPGEVLFPGGGSGQACLGGTISYGGISVGLEACYVHTPHGEGVAITPSVTAGPGIGVNVHAGAGESNACRPSEYGGLFSQVGGSAELGTGVYYGRFSSFPYNELSGSRSVEGWTAGGSVGIGAEAGVGGSYTFTIPIGGESGGSGSSGCGC